MSAQRDDSGETVALLVVAPALIVAILVLLVHAFIVTNARAEAELAASEGLRSAWRAAADADLLADPDVVNMADAARDAVARTAATEQGWRWWTPDAAEVYSDWCADERPGAGETGWVRVTVSGEVFGPLASLWPSRWDRVYASAQGPAVLLPPRRSPDGLSVPAELPAC